VVTDRTYDAHTRRQGTLERNIMDNKLSVLHHNGGVSKPPVHGARKGGRQNGGGGGRKGIKVVYISSPMMLTASSEEFRAVVQELTGRDSNVADHDLHAAGAPSSSSYSSFGGRTSPTTTMVTGAARAMPPQTMATATAGPQGPAEYYAAALAAVVLPGHVRPDGGEPDLRTGLLVGSSVGSLICDGL
jgi:hypothetical protein